MLAIRQATILARSPCVWHTAFPLCLHRACAHTVCVQPYLPFLASDPVLDTLLVNLVTRMASSVTADPYANAFNADSTTPGDHGDDTVTPAFGNAVYESKYELDSLAAFLKLSRGVYEHSPTLFKEGVTPAYTEWLEAVRIAVDSMIAQQQSTDEEMEGGGQAYKFARMTDTSTDTLMQVSW